MKWVDSVRTGRRSICGFVRSGRRKRLPNSSRTKHVKLNAVFQTLKMVYEKQRERTKEEHQHTFTNEKIKQKKSYCLSDIKLTIIVKIHNVIINKLFI